MNAQMIPFPPERIVRYPDLIDALDRLAMIDDYELSGDPIKMAVAAPMREYWEGELVRLGGVSPALLRKDGEAGA